MICRRATPVTWRSRRYSNGALRCSVRNATLRSSTGAVCRGARATASISRPCECSQLRYSTTFSSRRVASWASEGAPLRAVTVRCRSEYSIRRAAFHRGAARGVEAAAVTGIYPFLPMGRDLGSHDVAFVLPLQRFCVPCHRKFLPPRLHRNSADDSTNNHL